MALNWIKWVKGLSRRREVLAAAQILGLDRRIVACACMELWEWADENTTTGLVNNLAASDIDPLVSINGFGSALCTVGWLTVRSDGIQFPRWDRHNSASAKERALDSERKRRKRGHENGPDSVQKTSGKKPDSIGTRQEKRRGEKSINGVLMDLSLEELKRPAALLARYKQCVAARAVLNTPVNLLWFFACAERAVECATTNPAGFFRRLIETNDRGKPTQAQEDRAKAKLDLLARDPDLPRPSSPEEL